MCNLRRVPAYKLLPFGSPTRVRRIPRAARRASNAQCFSPCRANASAADRRTHKTLTTQTPTHTPTRSTITMPKSKADVEAYLKKHNVETIIQVGVAPAHPAVVS